MMTSGILEPRFPDENPASHLAFLTEGRGRLLKERMALEPSL
jgi:hypothetical protein